MVEPRKNKRVSIWTDGAAKGFGRGPAGAGVVVVEGELVRLVGIPLGRQTNNVAELVAIREALLLVRDRQADVMVHSDSRYSIGVLRLGWVAQANTDLIREIVSLIRKFRRVRFSHVKGHSGIAQNEVADRLASDAAVSQERTDRTVPAAGKWAPSRPAPDAAHEATPRRKERVTVWCAGFAPPERPAAVGVVVVGPSGVVEESAARLDGAWNNYTATLAAVRLAMVAVRSRRDAICVHLSSDPAVQVLGHAKTDVTNAELLRNVRSFVARHFRVRFVLDEDRSSEMDRAELLAYHATGIMPVNRDTMPESVDFIPQPR